MEDPRGQEVQGAGDGLGHGFTRRELAPQVNLHVLQTRKFKTATIKIALRRNLTPEEAAANACIPFVLRRGSRRFPTSRDVARFLEHLYGAQLAVDSVKVGETQVLDFTLEVAEPAYLGIAESPLREGLRFLGDLLFHPQQEGEGFRTQVLAQEVEGLRRRIEGVINHKPQYALERLRQVMCQDEPYGLHRYGTVERLQALTPEQLFAHYRQVLAESPVDIFIVGDVKPDEVAQWVGESLPFPRGQVQAMKEPVSRTPRQVREKVEEEDVHQGVLALGLRTPVRYPDDGYERLLVYNGILGGFPHSKLFINVREKASLAYFAASRLEGTKGVLVAFAGIDPQRYGQARAIVERQVDDMAAGRISDEELEATKKAIIHGLRTVTDSPHRLIDRHLLGLVNGRVRPLEETIAAIEGVSRDDVVRIAQGIVPDTVYFLTRASEDGGTAGSEAGSPEGGEGE